MVKRRKRKGLAASIEANICLPDNGGPAWSAALVAQSARDRRRDQRPGLRTGDVAQADPRRGSTASAPRRSRRMALAASGAAAGALCGAAVVG